jgi:hypothetical protein
MLGTCNAPTGIKFCDWIDGRCGKAACGMSEEDLAKLQSTPVDPTDAACVPVTTNAACLKICPE